MNTIQSDTLYYLLPEIYRQRDKQHDEILRALLAIISDEFSGIEKNINQAYENCFIETCEDKIIPYIADLLEIEGLHNKKQLLQSQRSRVANTIRYRRRKGQGSVIESIMRDVTGWPTKLVEYFQSISTTQHMQHIRHGKGTTANIRNVNGINTLDTPFDVNAHTVEVNNVGNSANKYSLTTVGLFLWRLKSYPIYRGYAKEINGQDRAYTFHPLGTEMPLFNHAETAAELVQTIREADLPVAMRNAAVNQDLMDYRSLPDELKSDNSQYYGPNRSFYIVKIDATGKKEHIKHQEIIAMNLKDWAEPPVNKVAVDVALGRIKLGPETIKLDDKIILPKRLEVNYHYGFSADMAGGHYSRQTSLIIPHNVSEVITVSKQGVADFSTLGAALKSWVTDNAKSIIRITDDATYDEDLKDLEDLKLVKAVRLTNGRKLIIQAAENTRPCINLTTGLQLQGTASQDAEQINQVVINGLLIAGAIQVQGYLQLTLEHCTLVPTSETDSETDNVLISLYNSSDESEKVVDSSQLKVVISHSIIVGMIDLPASISSLDIKNSIIDAKGGIAISGDNKLKENDTLEEKGPRLSLIRSTVFGQINVIELINLSEAIVTKKVTVERIQTGCVRYSSLPSGLTPQRYRCQPELALSEAKELATERGLISADEEKKLLVEKFSPKFTSQTYGQPGYAQLNRQCDVVIRSGAQDTAEMGVFQHLQQSQRESNLAEILAEYLPFDREVRIFYVT